MDIFANAQWIRPATDYGETAPLFKREFNCKNEVASAKLYITAMGVYEAFLNGSRIGNFIMAPGFMAYDKRHQYQCYDITEFLEKENKIEVTVGKGWYRGDYVAYRHRDIWGACSAIIAVIAMEYKNGEKEEIVTDNGWFAAPSKIRSSQIYDGEKYDASFETHDFERVCHLHSTKATLIAQEGEIVREYEHIAPKRIFNTPKGERVIDFGQNLTGYVAFSVDAKAGDRIVYTHAEILDAEGNFYTDNLRSAKQRVEYIAKDGRQSYKPHHTFMGFQYIRIDEAPEYINLENFEAIAVHSEMDRTGYFECSSEKINKLYSNIIWSQRDNFLDIPTDCPQRDERLGWTGDAQVFVKAASYNFNVKKFFRKWLRDLAAEQHPDGAVPYVIPDVVPAGSCAAWGDAATICPWQIYITYGDKSVLEDQIDSMIKWVNYMRGRGEEEYLWLGDDQLGDWLGLDAQEGSYKGSSDTDLIASAYFAYSANIVAKALKVLGRDASEFEELYRNIRKAYMERFNKFKTQTELAVTLKFGLTDDKKALAAQLADMIEANGNKLTTGFVGTPYLLDALSENGYTDVAYSLLLQEEYPSWLFSVNMGATTVWEHWDGMREDGTMWSTDMNSFNHYAYGSVAAWMYETICGIGIDEEAPGGENIILRPHPDKRLSWAKASIETNFGKVSSAWKYTDSGIEYEFSVPNSAKLILNGEVKNLEKGTYKFKA